MKIFSSNAVLSLTTALGLCMIFSICSCGSKNSKEKDEKTFQERSVEVPLFAEMPVKGDNAEYFTIVYPEGKESIMVKGIPGESSMLADVKAEVLVKVNKKFDDEIISFGSNGLTLHLLDEDHEDLGHLRMSKADREVLEKELGKDEPGTVKIIFKDSFFSSNYDEIFEKAKYIRIEDADLKGKSEYESERARVEKESSSNSSSYSTGDDDYESGSGRYESADEPDDDGYDDDDPRSMKTAYKKAKSKVSSKAKDLKEKAAEKINDWLDR